MTTRRQSSSFNPRPPFPGGDAIPSVTTRNPLTSFNPRPPFPGGDAPCTRWPHAQPGWFQSTPPVSGRRCGTHGAPPRFGDCFNPRPPFPGGDAAARNFSGYEALVSIHAPRFREAMLHLDLRAHQRTAVSIHAPRFREAMRRLNSPRKKPNSFQSTPPVSGRRCDD